MNEARKTLQAVLATPINLVLQKHGKPPVWVSSTESIDKAFKKLFKHKIHSLPLFDVEKNRFTNFIETVDLLLFVTQISKTHTAPLREVYANLSRYTCADVANLAGRATFTPIDDAVSLEIAISEIRYAKLERLVVLNPDRVLVGVLSMSCIVRFLAPTIAKLAISNEEIQSVELGYRPVPTIEENALISDAFKQIYARGIHAIGVVRKVGDREKLVGNLSASDLRNAECESLEIFTSLSTLTVRKFMKRMGQEQITSVKPSDTVARVAKLFLKKKYHQIYIIDNQEAPGTALGIINLYDILDLVGRVMNFSW